jgi:seryl-tRNA synthetase
VTGVEQDVNHVLDARLVGVFMFIFTVALVPLLRWVGGLAVKSAMDKFIGLDAKVADVMARYERSEERQNAHGRKLEVTAQNAEHAYRKAASIEPRVSELEITSGRLEGRVDRAEKDIDKLDDKVQTHLSKIQVA